MKEKVTLKKLKSREREARVDIIIDAAERVFATKSFDKASMREIADEAGMATSSIYRFFPNQEALFVESALREHNHLIELLAEKISVPENEFNIVNVINAFIDFISQHDSYFRMMVILMSQGNLSPDSSKKILDVMSRSLDIIDTAFRKMSYKGDVRMISRYFFATLTGITVSFNKIPGKTEAQGIILMKEMAKIAGNVMKIISDTDRKI